MEEKRLLKKKIHAKEDGNLEQLAHYCRELGDHYRKIGKFSEALVQFKEEEVANECIGNTIAVAISNRMIGEIYCDLGEFKEALKYQEKHLDLARMENAAIEEQRALANIGRTYFCMAESITSSKKAEYNSSLSSAKKAYIQSLGVCENLKCIGTFEQMEMRARLLMNIGLVLECQGLLNRAVEYIEKAIQIGKQHELWEDLCKCYLALGMLHNRSGDHNHALRNLNLALDVADRLDSKVRTKCEILLSKAEVFFQISDFGGAKQSLLKAYKMKTPDERDRKSIEKNLRIAVTLCQTEEAVLLTEEKDNKKLKSLYEALGDGAVAVQNFKKAIEYYLKMLKCAEDAGESGRDLCPIYFSLSQTYKDHGEYELALEYSKKELEYWQDVPHEACKTSLSMAEILELKNSPYIEVAGTYMRAKEFAEKSQDSKLLLSTLRSFQTYQRNSGLEELADKTEMDCEKVCQRCNIPYPDAEDEDTDENDSQCIGEYINLDELSESNSDENENGDHKEAQSNLAQRRSRRKATCKGIAVRRNEKGETALHRACITGNVALVRSLLDRGHPINTRDHCGWTPLHEACNHGYREIVSMLIEKGAQVNDRGGTHCGGVTPIHDAAACGNLSIVQDLLAAGASVLARTDKGETPLDCLMNWYRRVENEIDNYTKEEFSLVEKELRKSLEKVGQETSSSHPSTTKENGKTFDLIESTRNSHLEKRNKTTGKRVNEESRISSSKKRNSWINKENFDSLLSSSSSEDESIVRRQNKNSLDEEGLRRIKPSKSSSSDVKSNSSKDLMHEEDCFSSSEYVRTIASLKNRQSLLSMSSKQEKQYVQPLVEKSPHLEPDEVDTENWLEDDLALMRPSKRTKKSESSTTGGTTYVRHDSKNSFSTMANSKSPEPEPEEDYSPVIEEFPPTQVDEPCSTPVEVPTRVTASSTPISNSYRASSDEVQPNLQLIKVDVEGTLLLVPLVSLQNPTFECLATEVSRRYYEFKGVRLELSLHTKDGALLSKNDSVLLLSSLDESNRVLVAKVTSLNLPPISESYEESCSACNIKSNPLVKQSLEACQMTHSLSLEDLDLTTRTLSPVIRAISHRYLSLRCLLLSNNDIGDKGLKMLGECLPSMTNLVALDLSSNNITDVGLSELSNLFSGRSGAVHNPPLQMLGELNLSHNPLKDSSIPYLITFLNGLLSLTSLSLRDCDLSNMGLATGYDDPNPLCLDSVDHLDASYNSLGAEGIAAFLRCLNPSKIKVLNLGRTLLSRNNKGGNQMQSMRKIAREVALFLDHDEFSQPKNLVQLDLSQIQVTDSDISEILRGLKGATHLEHLNLECNPDLTSLTLRRFLQQSIWPNLILNLSGCPKVLDYIECDESVINWMDYRCGQKPWWPHAINLSIGSNVSMGAVDNIIAMWNKALGSDSKIERGMFGHLKLGVKSE